MTTRRITFSLDEFYHLYSRGVDKRLIFLDDQDKKRFVKLLYVCNGTKPVIYKTIQALPLDEIEIGERLVAIGAYCLMPNHFHLLIREVSEGGAVKFMSKLLTAYSSYFNKKYDRTGALFGSEFKSTHADNDEYLKYLFAYIHLNPLKLAYPRWKEDINNIDLEDKGLFLKDYAFSSYPSYIEGIAQDNLILSTMSFPEYFLNSSEWKEDINSWISTSDLIQALPLDKTVDK